MTVTCTRSPMPAAAKLSPTRALPLPELAGRRPLGVAVSPRQPPRIAQTRDAPTPIIVGDESRQDAIVLYLRSVIGE
jgi:hypothetical protein